MVIDAWPGSAAGHVAYVELVQDSNHFVVTHANFAIGNERENLDRVVIRECRVVRQGANVLFGEHRTSLPLAGFLVPR